jgi:hypothetical protein
MSLKANIAAGALAGIAGAAAMHVFRLAWERAIGNKPELGIFGFDHEADVNSAQLLSRVLLRREISETAAARAGIALHYSYGAIVGAAYAVSAQRLPQIREGFGAGFGALLWLAGDEIPIAALGISEPRSKSAASHAAALSAHLIFGAVLEAMVRERAA